MKIYLILFLSILILISGCKAKEQKELPPMCLREDGYLVPAIDMIKVKQYKDAPEDWDFICKEYPYEKKVPKKVIKRLQEIGFVKGKGLVSDYIPTSTEVNYWCDMYFKNPKAGKR